MYKLDVHRSACRVSVPYLLKSSLYSFATLWIKVFNLKANEKGVKYHISQRLTFFFFLLKLLPAICGNIQTITVLSVFESCALCGNCGCNLYRAVLFNSSVLCTCHSLLWGPSHRWLQSPPICLEVAGQGLQITITCTTKRLRRQWTGG